jgi:hypothetical protein
MTEAKETKAYPATVVRVIDDHRVVINRGAEDGVRGRQRFLVYHLDTKPIKDPETGQDLGPLEIVKGPGIADHVQKHMTTLSSSRKGTAEKRVVKRRPRDLFDRGAEEETIELAGNIEPFNDAVVGDKAKPI